MAGCGGSQESGDLPRSEPRTSASATSAPGGGVGRPDPTAQGDAAADRFGTAADPNPDVTYQPDVVVLPSGPDAIVAGSADGLAWTLDPGAQGVDGLDEGQVLFASSRVVGRIVSLDPTDQGVVATLAPVELGEIVKEGTLEFDQELAVNDLAAQVIPEALGALQPADGPPGARSRPIAGSLPLLPDRSLVPMQTEGPGLPAPSVARSVRVQVQPFDVSLATKEGEISVSVGYVGSHDIVLGIKAGVRSKGAKVKATGFAELVDGEITDSSVYLDGLTDLFVEVDAGVGSEVDRHRKAALEIPIELLTVPIVVAGVPTTFTIKFKVAAELDFKSKNTTLTTRGRFGIGGSMGGSTGPAATVELGVLDALAGVGLGNSSMKVAVEMKASWGVGAVGFTAGPYAKLRLEVGAVRAGDMNIVSCRASSTVLKHSFGVGIGLSSTTAKLIQDHLGRRVKLEGERTLRETKLLDQRRSQPTAAVCE